MAQLRKPKLSSRARKLLYEGQQHGFLWVFKTAGLSGEQDVVDDAQLSLTYSARQMLLTDIANLRDEAAIRWFWKRHRVAPAFKQELIEIRDELRTIWAQPTVGSERILNKWLNWRPSKEILQLLRHLRGLGPPNSPLVEDVDFMPFTCSIRACRLVPNYDQLRSMLIQGVFEHWPHFRYCTNLDCVSPYFIAKRKDQTVCDSDICKAEKQRQHALRWWRANRKNQKQQRHLRNNIAKGKRKHGTREAQ